jgi:hypothetical protein
MMMCIYIYICIYSQSNSRPATDTNALELIGTNKYIVVSSICPRSSQSIKPRHAYYYAQNAMQRCCVFLLYEEHGYTYVRACWSLDACMLVWAGPGGKVHFVP